MFKVEQLSLVNKYMDTGGDKEYIGVGINTKGVHYKIVPSLISKILRSENSIESSILKHINKTTIVSENMSKKYLSITSSGEAPGRIAVTHIDDMPIKIALEKFLDGNLDTHNKYLVIWLLDGLLRTNDFIRSKQGICKKEEYDGSDYYKVIRFILEM